MTKVKHAVLLITTATPEEAHKIANGLLEKKKAACVNIVDNIHSHFWWQGKIDSARENLLIVKTRASLIPEVVRLVKELHSYSVPEVIALPVIGGNPDYLKWIDESTA